MEGHSVVLLCNATFQEVYEYFPNCSLEKHSLNELCLFNLACYVFPQTNQVVRLLQLLLVTPQYCVVPLCCLTAAQMPTLMPMCISST